MNVVQHMAPTVLTTPTTATTATTATTQAVEQTRLPPGVWRASQQAAPPAHLCPTHHAALSRWLPGGGWPLGSLIEVLTEARGSGELALVAPALADLPTQRPIVLLNPPGMPNALAWQQWQIASHRLWWIHSKNLTDAWWSAETVLRSRSFAALLAWVDPIEDQALRRLHASVQDTTTLTFLFRPQACSTQFSPCPLRLVATPTTNGLSIEVLKSKGRKPAEPMTVALGSGVGLEMRQTRQIKQTMQTKASHVDCHRTRALAS